MDFYEWVVSRRITDTPRGDFIKDVKESSNFPKPDDKKCIEDYLKKKHACKEAMLVFRKLWNEYEKPWRVRK